MSVRARNNVQGDPIGEKSLSKFNIYDIDVTLMLCYNKKKHRNSNINLFYYLLF